MGDYVMIDDKVYYRILSYNQGLEGILFETVPIIPCSHNNFAKQAFITSCSFCLYWVGLK